MPRYEGARERLYIELEHIPVPATTPTDAPVVLEKGFVSRHSFPTIEHTRTIKALRVDAIVGGAGDYARGFANLLAGLRATILVGDPPKPVGYPSVDTGAAPSPYPGHLTFVRGLFKTQSSDPQEEVFETFDDNNRITSRRTAGFFYTFDKEGHITSKRPSTEADDEAFVNGKHRVVTSPESDEAFINGKYRDLPHIHHGINGVLPKDILIGSRGVLGVELHYDGQPVPLTFLRVVLLGIATRDVA